MDVVVGGSCLIIQEIHMTGCAIERPDIATGTKPCIISVLTYINNIHTDRGCGISNGRFKLKLMLL